MPLSSPSILEDKIGMADQMIVVAQGGSGSGAKVLRMLLLSPFAFLYGIGVWLRNKLFDWKIWQSKTYPIPIICVGNLELGGSGKTPMSDWLIKMLHLKYKIAYLSRGYGRQSKGSVVANESSSISDLGDEPYLIYQRWKNKIALVVEADRRKGVELIKRTLPDVNLILLDDGFQHRWVVPKVSVLLTPFTLPFFQNFLFPSGTLRDERSQYKRADVVVFSRCAELSQRIHRQVQQIWKDKGLIDRPLFLSAIRYEAARNWKGEFLAQGRKVVAVAGLANNEPFFSKVKSIYSIDQFISKPDHYAYLPSFFSGNRLENKTILTTEKDFFKLSQQAPDPDRVYFLPITIEIYPEDSFIQTLENQL